MGSANSSVLPRPVNAGEQGHAPEPVIPSQALDLGHAHFIELLTRSSENVCKAKVAVCTFPDVGRTWRLRVEEAQERERIEQELRVARQIQQALLPEATPELHGWRLTTSRLGR
jgi:hypothetical protein